MRVTGVILGVFLLLGGVGSIINNVNSLVVQHAQGLLKQNTVVATVMSNFGLELALSACGARLVRTMAFDWYAKIAPEDLDALVAYLRTVKPLKTR